MKRNPIIGTLIGLGLGLTALSAQAQNYPNRVVTIVVPVAAGGPTDVVARLTATRLSERVGHPVIVQNILGGGGVVGTDSVARSKPDGYTLYLGVNSMAIYPNVRAPNNPLPFDPVKDFAPIGGIATSAHVFVVPKSLGVKSIGEFVAMAKAKPGALSYGSAGVGGTTHLPPALFAHRVGINMLHVPYKGAAPALQDTIAGRVSLSAPGYSGSLDQFVNNGSIVPIAVTSSKRLPFMPNVPTLVESGYADMSFPIWYGLFAPAQTPQDVISRLSTELEAMSKETQFRARLYAQGNVSEYIPPAQLGRMLADGIKDLAARIKASGIRVAE